MRGNWRHELRTCDSYQAGGVTSGRSRRGDRVVPDRVNRGDTSGVPGATAQRRRPTMHGIEPTRRPTGPPGPGGRSLGVAVVDPVPIYRDGLAALVHRSQGLHWAGQAASHHAALQLCEQVKPDVVVLDSAL